ncbi:uncharacterized protein LOC128758239 [Synchiropus splendidus]|uniref:uncharacterized protein LOC128758239 n=1 Tax=Synchiropus splendidus TaxID=270530 RepID=UPI00237DC745|nr:uncharacterized protein LOC128758239 [Synchiropus splendidus]
MQSNQISGLSSRTSSTTTLDREPSGSTARPQIAPSFKRGSLSCGTPSHCASSLGSQESLQTGFCSSADRRGSWERAHIAEAPNKVQTQFSNLSPVKIGWLPIQRRVMKVSGASDQSSDVSPGLVKLKQPITPMIQIGRATNSICQGTEVGRSDSRHGATSGRTWLTPDQGSTIVKQVPEKQCSTYHEVNKPVGWQALRRGFKISRQPSVTTASPAAASSLDQQKERQCTDEPNKSPALLQSPVSPVSQTSLRSGQPLRATGPVCVSNSGSAVTTIVPQRKGSFSSITISSRKVSRSASLPGSDSSCYKNSDSNSQKFTMQRNATIVKVTEQRTIEERVPPLNSLDTVVQRRKATIIKVTEHRESYSPASGRNGTRHPAYRHSYTEGSHNNIQSNAAVPYHRVDFSEKSSDSVAPYSPGLVKNSDRLHTSTISVFVNNPPAIAAPVREVTPSPMRSARPASCYGSVLEPQTEHGKHPLVRKWSFEAPEVTSNPENPGRNFVKSEASPVVVDGTSTYQRDKPFLPQTDDVLKRSSPNLTPVKVSDPQTPQSPEDILALNAAAVIASIKQLSSQRKKTNLISSERDSNASPRGNIGIIAPTFPQKSH